MDENDPFLVVITTRSEARLEQLRAYLDLEESSTLALFPFLEVLLTHTGDCRWGILWLAVVAHEGCAATLATMCRFTIGPPPVRRSNGVGM